MSVPAELLSCNDFTRMKQISILIRVFAAGKETADPFVEDYMKEMLIITI